MSDTPTKQKSNMLRDLTLIILAAVFVNVALVLWSQRGPNIPDDVELKSYGRMPPIAAEGWVNHEGEIEPLLNDGKIVVVLAWATWCGPCRADMPAMVELYERFNDRVVFIGLTNEGPEAEPQIKNFLDSVGATWPNGYGAYKTLWALQADTIPTEYVATPDGELKAVVRGPDQLEAALEELLADRSL